MTEQPVDQQAAEGLLARALRRARWTILWERLWPALASLATAVGLFLALSWAGVWLVLPPIGRAIGLFLLLALAAVSSVPLDPPVDVVNGAESEASNVPGEAMTRPGANVWPGAIGTVPARKVACAVGATRHASTNATCDGARDSGLFICSSVPAMIYPAEG